jgi:hypothetical protein
MNKNFISIRSKKNLSFFTTENARINCLLPAKMLVSLTFLMVRLEPIQTKKNEKKTKICTDNILYEKFG